jgi:hypothetical protein
MAQDLQINNSQPIAGLGTFNFTVTTAGSYYVACKSFIQPGSGLQIALQHNGSPVVTVGGSSQNPSSSQTSIGTGVYVYCVATDTLSIVLTSSNSIDSIPNNVKSVTNLFYQMAG